MGLSSISKLHRQVSTKPDVRASARATASHQPLGTSKKDPAAASALSRVPQVSLGPRGSRQVAALPGCSLKHCSGSVLQWPTWLSG